MRLLRPISEDEMIAVFLRGELDSDRYGEKLAALLRRDGRGANALREPDLGDADANAYRRGLLDEHRAYARREGLFLGFPRDVEWHRASLARDEVLEIRYIDWDWWLDLSGGTRRPRDAARRILAGDIADSDLEADRRIAAAAGAQPGPPELIAATTRLGSSLVLVEGHMRLTAYATFPDELPAELEIILGISEAMSAWALF